MTDPVEAYCNLDLSSADAALTDGLEEEIRQPEIELSGSHDPASPSPGMSPHAGFWFNAHVAPTRSNALAAIHMEAQSIRLDGDAPGFATALELDEIERRRAIRLKEVTEEFRQKNSATMNEYTDKQQAYRRLRNKEGGREAKVPSHWLEFGLLLPLVVLPESLLNFGAFRKAPLIDSDFMALGTTLLVAIGIAVAAHFAGLFVRRINYYRRGDDQVRGHQGWPQLAIALVLLIIGLAVVGSARYYYVLPKIEQAIVLGTTPPNVAFSVGSMLFGNLLCFLIGAAFTFALHDENPEYESAARSLHKLGKELGKLKRKQLDGKVNEINRRLESDRTDVERKKSIIETKPAYIQLARRMQAIQAKDREIIARLQDYRRSLGQKLQQERPEFRFTVKDYSGDPMRITKELTIAEYMTQPIHLHYSRS